jgi:hypothetical protein
VFETVRKDDNVHSTGFYYVHYATNEVFKKHLKDGFTLEVLCKPYYYVGGNWETPFGSTTFRVYNYSVQNNDSTYSFVANGAENNWLSKGIFGGWWNFGTVKVQSYEHIVLTYDGNGKWNLLRNGEQLGPWTNAAALNAGNALAIGAIPYTGSRGTHLYCGEIAIARIYDSCKSAAEVAARYNELKPTIATLEPDYQFDLLVDAQFNNDGTATDKVKGYTITKETIGDGGTLTVTDGVVTLGDSDDNMSYYKIDLTQDDALKTSMNNGFTIETILASPNNNTGWAGAFGGEGFSLLRLAGYGYKWNINLWRTDDAWKYCDGTIAPVANQYYHILYAYSAQTGQLDVYRDGVCENKDPNFKFVMRENSTVVIGARMDGGKIFQSWLGNIATFAIYEKPSTAAYAEIRYAEVKATVDALNGVTAQ